MVTRLNVWQVFKRESWPNRTVIVAAALVMVLAAVNILVNVLVGILGGAWLFGAMFDSAQSMAVAGVVIGWIYWRHRAREAEKPLPPTQVVTTYSTVGAADIARMVERQRRRESAETAGRTNA